MKILKSITAAALVITLAGCKHVQPPKPICLEPTYILHPDHYVAPGTTELDSQEAGKWICTGAAGNLSCKFCPHPPKFAGKP